MKALAQVVPHQVSAGVGNLQVVAFSGKTDDENYWVYMDIMEGSYGGRYGKDGMDAVDTLYANTRNNPIEDIESHYPLRVNRYELRDNESAPGKWRGGIGSIREITFLGDGSFSVEADGHKFAPWGFDGGKSGSVGGLSIRNDETGETLKMPSKLPNRHVTSGNTIQLVGPCGGGYGNPLERDPEKVLSDYLDGYLTKSQAKEEYGVVITENNLVDVEQTTALRNSH